MDQAEATTAHADSAVRALAAAVDAVLGDDLAEGSAGALGERAVALDVLVARLRFEQARTAVAFEAAGGPLHDGFASGAAWLRARTSASPGEAADLVRTGRALRDRLPATAAAAQSGAIGWAAVSAVAQSLRAVQDGEVLAEADRTLARLAPTLHPTGVAHAARRILQHLDPELAQRDAARRWADRSLTLAPMLDGAISVHGQLDESSAAVILSALAPMTTPRGPEDLRTAAQRRVDALVELVGRAAETGAAGAVTGTGLPPTVVVRVDVAALVDLHAGLAGRSGDCPAAADGHRPRIAPPELDWGGPILRETLERIGCSAQLVRLVTDGPSQILDLGRARRLASPAQKLALAARDRGCVFPGCDRPPEWTDAHHLRPFSRGGATDLDELALLCRFHHRLVHEGGWTLRRGPDGLHFCGPDGVSSIGPATSAVIVPNSGMIAASIGNASAAVGCLTEPDSPRPPPGRGTTAQGVQ